MYHIIYNPIAGKKKALKNLREVQSVLQNRGVAYELHETQACRDAETIARELTSAGHNDLIVLGGDGTLHEVLNGIVDPTQCRLGIVPSGTGNDFVEGLGIPFKVTEALELILAGNVKDTDYLVIGDRRCMNIAGLGVDVDVLVRCTTGKMRGKLKYIISLFQTIFAFKGYPITLEVDGKVEERNILIATTCNGTQFGGGIRMCPPAKVDDGKIDVVIVDSIKGKGKILKALMMLMKGKILEHPKATHFLCDSIRIGKAAGCPVQLDGEVYYDLTYDARVERGLKIYR